MKLISFSVTNYRSITRAHKIQLNDLTILVGKNNEGKSNIIKAISLSMNIIKKYSIFLRKTPFSEVLKTDSRVDYIWNRDFPILSQNKQNGSKVSTFELEFLLSNEELHKFNKLTNSRLSTPNFIIIIEIGEDNYPKIKVSKKGTSRLNKKIQPIKEFISENIVFNYIPAIRTESQAIELIRETLSNELKTVENEQEYIDAVNTINRLQRKPLDGIAKKVKDTLQIFIPSIEEVKIDIEENTRRLSLRRDIEVMINDGVLTNIERKGDGIKSLATLAMLTDRYNVEQSSIIAIDEPEAHLHPGAIRQLNGILQDLSKNNQVIISTHNQLFANSLDTKSNVIVSSGKATPAKNIKEVRDVLGVKLEDNLISCSFRIFVEGLTDKIIIESLLSKNQLIKKGLINNELCVESLGGASKLTSKIYESINFMFNFYVLLDHDDCGIDAFEKAKKQGLLDESKITFITCNGKRYSEIEDIIKPNIYVEKINERYNVHIKIEDFNGMKKWSDQLKFLFLNEGKLWNDDVEKNIKEIVAMEVSEKIKIGEEVFIENRKSVIDSFINNIESIYCKLDKRK